jgi:signal transduction histidine kinase/CheY-like chemotaxis protein
MNSNRSPLAGKKNSDNIVPLDVDAALLWQVALVGMIFAIALCVAAILNGRVFTGVGVSVIAIVIGINLYIAPRTGVTIATLHISLAVISFSMMLVVLLAGLATPGSAMLLALLPFIMGALGDRRGLIIWLSVDLAILALVYLHGPYASSHYTESPPDPALHHFLMVLVLTGFITIIAYALMGKRHGYLQQLADTNRRLKLAADTVREANESKGRFLGRLSHELRTPLNAILGFAEMMGRHKSAPLSHGQRQKLDHIERSGMRLLEIVDEILEITRQDQSSGFAVLLPTALKPLLLSAVERTAPIAERTGITLNVDASVVGRDAALADERLLGQVLDELITNAIQFNQPGGRVDLSVRKSDGKVSIIVRDTGIGIPADRINDLFEPFHRLARPDAPANAHPHGAGLGLTKVQSFIRRMNGRVDVVSAPQKGASFTVTLDAYEGVMSREVERAIPPAAPAVPAKPVSDHPEVAPYVLYVEDNILNQSLMQSMFEALGYDQLAICTTGEEALERVTSAPPRLLLLDIHLPDCNGIELLQRIRLMPGLGNTPAIAVSADALPDHVELALASGFAEYLTKPVRLERLRVLLQTHLPSTREAT